VRDRVGSEGDDHLREKGSRQGQDNQNIFEGIKRGMDDSPLETGQGDKIAPCLGEVYDMKGLKYCGMWYTTGRIR
jgi:hypothetical protein